MDPNRGRAKSLLELAMSATQKSWRELGSEATARAEITASTPKKRIFSAAIVGQAFSF